jgi:polyketide synthase PksN
MIKDNGQIVDILRDIKNRRLNARQGFELIKQIQEQIPAPIIEEPQVETGVNRRLAIAVVGMSGRFPGAGDIAEFWDNLANGRDHVTEIPRERWDANSLFDPDSSDPHKSYSKWGGFLSGIDRFDPIFFNISPREAELMDPQQRLFLQEAWRALEDAGYSRQVLDRKKCGVFVGCSAGDYQDIIIQNQLLPEAYMFMGNASSILAARVSYFLNLRGPSVSIDTACSSALVATHLAIESIQQGTVEMAVAGGVTILSTPKFHVWSSKSQMLSPTGKCRTFDNSADGFVPGEGAAAVVLKDLAAAERDSDHIYGVIRGSLLNQDGKTNGITAPSAPSQTELERAVYDTFDLPPDTITYIETHGTGTKLGDPIELQALNDAFGAYTSREGFCALGSVKTNIGHALAAAGVASLIKALLCLKHGRLVPSLHFERANEHFDLDNSPFYVNTENTVWAHSGTTPRRAAISSFGFSGTNAHLVVEEYIPAPRPAQTKDDTPQLIVLSAMDSEVLARMAHNLVEFLDTHEVALQDLAFTLQMGREPLEERLAFVARNLERVKEVLGLVAQRQDSIPGCYRGAVETAPNRRPIESGDLEVLARLWVEGTEIQWRTLHQHERPMRVSLPTYPFKRGRYWVEAGDGLTLNAKALAAVIDVNESTFEHCSYKKRYSGNEFFIAHHGAVLPAVVYLEMTRTAAELALPGSRVAGFRKVTVSNPIFITNPRDVKVELYHDGGEGQVRFAVKAENGDGDWSLHSTGFLQYGEGPVSAPPSFDVPALLSRCSGGEGEAAAYFQRIEDNWGKLGPRFRGMREFYANDKEALSKVGIPGDMGDTLDQFGLHPILTDSAIQTMVAFGYKTGFPTHRLFLPYVMGNVQLFGGTADAAYAYVWASDEGGKTFSGVLLDSGGRVLARFEDFSFRPFQGAGKSEKQTLFYHSQWRKTESQLEPAAAAQETDASPIILFSNDMSLKKELEKHRPVILVKTGKRYRKTRGGDYFVNPDAPGDFSRLLEDLQADGVEPANIVWGWGGNSSTLTIKSLDRNLRRRLYSLIHLAKACLNSETTVSTRICYYFANTSGAPQPLDSAVEGFARALGRESGDVEVRVVEQREAPATTAADITRRGAEIVLHELSHAGAAGDGILVDRGIRRRRVFEEKAVTDESAPVSGPKQNGVYLITGGAGGLGMLFAGYLAETYQARLALADMAAEDEALREQLSRLRQLGSDVLYLQGDVSDIKTVKRMIASVHEQFGPIDGVLHCAGVLRDSLLRVKEMSAVEDVVAAKLRSAVAVDEALGGEKLDFFVMFSSLSAVLGSAGQCDYGYANNFLDHFASWREGLRLEGERDGLTLSINWPVWREGGMQTDERVRQLLRDSFGISLLDSKTGFRAFETALGQTGGHIGVLTGNGSKIRETFGWTAMETPSKSATVEVKEQEAAGHTDVESQFNKDLLDMAAGLLKMSSDRVAPDKKLSYYGFDSISFTELAQRLNTTFKLEVTPDLFFQHPTIGSIGAFIFQNNSQTITNYYSKQQPAALPEAPAAPVMAAAKEAPIAVKDVAIIGMSGRFPRSANLDEFWDNLLKGEDLIDEIPANRWNWRDYYQEQPSRSDRTNVIWGGFMADADCFDPLFFNISPREAELMDPQLRVMLETVWQTFEDAGYKPSSLAGSDTGVFIGVSTLDYRRLLDQVDKTGSEQLLFMVSNRISYALDLNGPSESIDTACSSSLVALHRAVESVRRGESSMAVAGGVNVISDPYLFIMQANAGMLSDKGHCYAFDKRANGYVRGEGAGAVLVKSASRAQADGDHIYAVVRGSGVNHCGHTNSPTTPNPVAQARLLARVYEEAGVEPETIGFIETHGTGTSLGDPIEINGLKQAFETMYQRTGKPMPQTPHCGLGALKACIGHLEAASGIAAVIKVALSLGHGVLPKNCNFEELNPYIKLQDGPFFMVDRNMEWRALLGADGQPLPRRGGVSSFGIGGTNAHICIEEYIPAETSGMTGDHRERALLFVLSARNQAQLTERASALAAFLKNPAQKDLSLEDIAYTLQTGREAFSFRLAAKARSRERLLELLGHYLDNSDGLSDLWTGRPSNSNQAVAGELDMENLDAAALAWVNGAAVDWSRLYAGGARRRVSLPTYPFARRRCWIPTPAPSTTESLSGQALGPLLERVDGRSSLSGGLAFIRVLHRYEPVVAHHVVGDRVMLPGVGYLEMALEAAAQVEPDSSVQLKNVVWLRPLVVEGEALDVRISLRQAEEAIAFTVTSGENRDQVMHAKGECFLEKTPATPPPESLPLQTLSARCEVKIDGNAHYATMEAGGVQYGDYFKGIEYIAKNDTEALGRFKIPEAYQAETGGYLLHPALMDCALQTLVGLRDGGANQQPALPFSVEEVCVYRPLPAEGFAHVSMAPGHLHYHIDIADSNGALCARVRDLALREIGAATVNEAADALDKFFFRPHWVRELLKSGASLECPPASSSHILVVTHKECEDMAQAIEQTFANRGHSVARLVVGDTAIWEGHADLQKIVSEKSIQQIYFLGGLHLDTSSAIDPDVAAAVQERGLLAFYRLIRYLLQHDAAGSITTVKVLVNDSFLVSDSDIPVPYGAGLAGFAASMAQEYARWTVSCIDVAKHDILDSRTSGQWQSLVEPIVEETAPLAALRRGKRFVRKIERVLLPPVDSTRTPLRQEGVYLVLGGAGGIGAELARFLSKQVRARVALVGRSPLDSRKEELLRSIRQLGGDGEYYQADAADFLGMQAVVSQVKARFGAVHGAFHSAIVLEDRILENMDEEILRAALTPKVEGSLALYKALENEALDFLVFFSSGQSIFPQPAQSNYAAGCSFKDAFARYLDRVAPFAVRTINWGYWGSVGVVASAEYNERWQARGIESIDPAEGMEAILRVISSPLPQVMAWKASDSVLRSKGIDLEKTVKVYPTTIPSLLKDVVEGLAPHLAGAAAIESISHKESLAAVDRLAAVLLFHALRSMGVFLEAGQSYPVEDLKTGLKILPMYSRLMDACLDILRRGDFITIENDVVYTTEAITSSRTEEELENRLSRAETLKGDYPGMAPFIHLLTVCAQELPHVLRGHKTHMEVMFPKGSMELVGPIYKGNEQSDFYNTLVAQSLAGFIRKRLNSADGGKVRILEVGAGTGGTSAAVLETIREFGDRVEYVYSDISKKFAQFGEREFGAEYPFTRFGVLDIERHPALQDYEGGSFDIIFGSNVFHATRRIRRTLDHCKYLLETNGLLILNEVTALRDISTLTFGLTEGWWFYEDEEVRIPGAPLLSLDKWKQLLTESGFLRVLAPCPPHQDEGEFMQHVVLAESDGVVASEPTPARVAPPPTPAAPTASHAEDLLTEILAAVLKIDPREFDAELPFQDYGVDSLLAVEIIDQLNERVGLSLRATDLFNFATIGELSSHIAGKMEHAPPEPPKERAEDIVMDVLCRVLRIGREEFDAELPFQDFGVDSLLAVEIIDQLNERAGLNLRATDLFNFSTIRELGLHIAGQHKEHGETQEKIPVTEPVGNLDDQALLELMIQLRDGRLEPDDVNDLLEEYYGG